MNIDHLRYFLVLTQEMHYGRAAQRLNISQSGLSHAMAALEQELGAPLFQKSGRGIALGRYGAALLPQAQQIVTLADNCLQSRPMVAAVPLDHPLAQQESVTLEETLPYPHVTYSWLSGQRDPVDRLFSPVRDRWHIAYEVEDANFILELVAQGFGITVLPDTPPVHRPGVKRLPVTDPIQTSDFYIVQFFDYCVGQANGMDLTNEQLPPSAR